MRYLSSVGMLKETAVDTFAATNVTRALANPGQEAGARFLLVSFHPILLSPPLRLFVSSFVPLATPAVEAIVNMLQSSFADQFSKL